MRPITQSCDLGKKAKCKLIEIDRTQTWLIERIKEDTGLYVDTSLLGRVWSGKYQSQKLIASICKILEIENPYEAVRNAEDSA